MAVKIEVKSLRLKGDQTCQNFDTRDSEAYKRKFILGTHKYGAQLSFYSLVPLNVECDGVSLTYCL